MWCLSQRNLSHIKSPWRRIHRNIHTLRRPPPKTTSAETTKLLLVDGNERRTPPWSSSPLSSCLSPLTAWSNRPPGWLFFQGSQHAAYLLQNLDHWRVLFDTTFLALRTFDKSSDKGGNLLILRQIVFLTRLVVMFDLKKAFSCYDSDKMERLEFNIFVPFPRRCLSKGASRTLQTTAAPKEQHNLLADSGYRERVLRLPNSYLLRSVTASWNGKDLAGKL